jgi:hypothetical protein
MDQLIESQQANRPADFPYLPMAFYGIDITNVLSI